MKILDQQLSKLDDQYTQIPPRQREQINSQRFRSLLTMPTFDYDARRLARPFYRRAQNCPHPTPCQHPSTW